MALPEALDALLKGLFDYAGLFPPAGLPLPEAVAQYSRHRHHARQAMLARFIVPIHKLEEFVPLALAARGPEEARWPLSVLAAAADSIESLMAGLHDQVSPLRQLRFEHGAHFEVQALELKLPAGSHPHELPALLKETGELLGPLARPWFELPAGEQDLEALVAALARYNDSFAGVPPAGLKLRCGGLQPADFPPVEWVARVLCASAARGVPLKFTAGLHHPVRHLDPGVGTRMHGFLNVILAAVLARELNLGRTELEQVLFCEDPAEFHVGEHSLGFRGWRLDPRTVSAARTTFATSIGSCSFAEPLADLVALGLLTAEQAPAAH